LKGQDTIRIRLPMPCRKT